MLIKYDDECELKYSIRSEWEVSHHNLLNAVGNEQLQLRENVNLIGEVLRFNVVNLLTGCFRSKPMREFNFFLN